MKNRKYLAWLIVFAVVFSIVCGEISAAVMDKSRNPEIIESVSLKIGKKKVTKKTYTIKQGDKKKLKVTASPKKGNKIVKFVSNNKNVAAVSKSGTITAKRAGTAKIKITVKSGKAKKATWMKVKVIKSSGSDKDTTTTEPQTPDVTQKPGTSEKPESDTESEVQVSEKHIVITTEQGNEIIFLLNDTPAANSFYNQLPLTVKVENYGSNEKIFYPPEKLDTTNGIYNSGILNYYAPWGDIFMLYGTYKENENEVSGDVNGVYTLGDVVSGREFIENMAGEIKIEMIDYEAGEEANANMRMKVEVNGNTFHAALEDNAAANALIEMMENEPVVIQMRDYSGFEKAGTLGKNLPASNSQITTESRDIVLYQGNQIVMFYGSNSWSYTRIGQIDDLTGWEEALGSKDVTVTFSLE